MTLPWKIWRKLVGAMGNDKLKKLKRNPKCCDNCKWYRWYWDACAKWSCEVYDNAVYSCFEPREDETDYAKELQSDA